MSASFEYKGVNSLDMYMRIRNEIIFTSPEADVDFVEVLGRDGELAIDNERLKGVPFSIPVTLKLPEDITIEQVASEIAAWLKNDVGWYPLRFSGSPDYEYLAIYTEQFKVAETLKNYGKTVLTFKLKPYKRRIGNDSLNLTNGATLYNAEKRTSKPLITIDGQGDITLKKNGVDWLVLTAVDGSVTVDSETMSVFKGTLPQFNKMNGNLSPMFPVLPPGENTITWVGNATKVTINPRWEAVV